VCFVNYIIKHFCSLFVCDMQDIMPYLFNMVAFIFCLGNNGRIWTTSGDPLDGISASILVLPFVFSCCGWSSNVFLWHIIACMNGLCYHVTFTFSCHVDGACYLLTGLHLSKCYKNWLYMTLNWTHWIYKMIVSQMKWSSNLLNKRDNKRTVLWKLELNIYCWIINLLLRHS